MNTRITEGDLKALVYTINELTGSPNERWVINDDTGESENCVGHYHLQHAYSGVRLARMVNKKGGIHTITGYGTKRHLYDFMGAFIMGIELGKSLLKP